MSPYLGRLISVARDTKVALVPGVGRFLPPTVPTLIPPTAPVSRLSLSLPASLCLSVCLCIYSCPRIHLSLWVSLSLRLCLSSLPSSHSGSGPDHQPPRTQPPPAPTPTSHFPTFCPQEQPPGLWASGEDQPVLFSLEQTTQLQLQDDHKDGAAPGPRPAASHKGDLDTQGYMDPWVAPAWRYANTRP